MCIPQAENDNAKAASLAGSVLIEAANIIIASWVALIFLKIVGVIKAGWGLILLPLWIVPLLLVASPVIAAMALAGSIIAIMATTSTFFQAIEKREETPTC